MKFVHISDLHYNPINDGRSSREIRESLINFLKDNGIKADELFVTGDYRHAKFQKEDAKEISEVVEYIKSVAKAIGINSIKNIHIVPGNHDRKRIQGEVKINKIRETYDSSNGQFKETDLKWLLKYFEYFYKVCNKLYGKKSLWKEDVLHTYCVTNDTVILYLNTAIMHNSDKDRKEHRLIIGNDCLDLLLREIKDKYPTLPIIILAHHSPDMFMKKEKEAVKEILLKYQNVKLYLCGDAHEPWQDNGYKHLEITVGCLKQDKGVEVTFLYGDTQAQEYTMFHWQGAWEPYVKINDIIKSFLKPPINGTSSSSTENSTRLTITVDGNGKMETDAAFSNSLLQWITPEKKKVVEVIIDDKRLKSCLIRLKEYEQKMEKGVHLGKEERDDYQITSEAIGWLEKWAAKKKMACELFLNDKYNRYAYIDVYYDAYLEMLRKIIELEEDKNPFREAGINYELIEVYIELDRGKGEFHYKYYIRRDNLEFTLKKYDGWSMDFGLCDVSLFDGETQKDILLHYYINYAKEALRYPSILKMEKTRNLSNYRIRIHP